MGRCLFGVELLLVFLLGGLWLSSRMTAVHEQVGTQLGEAAQAVLAGDTQRGYVLAQQAKSTWEQGWNGVATVADHAPMDEIDGLFAQLDAYGTAGFSADLAALCGRLQKLVEAVGEAHELTWWNLL